MPHDIFGLVQVISLQYCGEVAQSKYKTARKLNQDITPVVRKSPWNIYVTNYLCLSFHDCKSVTSTSHMLQ